ncbi:MAG: SPOR domain-containing protein [Legionella sp.]|nr:SPOR domain-containing protein [Legionella sp.]
MNTKLKLKLKITFLGLFAFSLSSCVTNQQHVTTDYNRAYVMYSSSSTPSSPQPYYQQDFNYQRPETQAVEVPESYHVNSISTPVSFRERDNSWVRSQNPQKYTIEIANGEKASEVAQKLSQTPKNDRMAQVKYKNNGKTYYKGVYGTFDDEAAAQKALDGLPSDLKQSAGVKDWGAIQGSVEE